MTDKETMPELLPCPFCGGDAICDIGMSPVGSKNYFVYCPEHMFHEAEVFSKDGMNKAIERWNTRHNPDFKGVEFDTFRKEALIELLEGKRIETKTSDIDVIFKADIQNALIDELIKEIE